MDVCTDPTLLECLSAAGPLETAKFLVSLLGLVGLIGIVAALISMRVAVCNQIYGRWQALIFKFADTAGAHEYLRDTQYTPAGSRQAAHFIAIGYLNLFEEAYRYHNSRVLLLWRVLPNSFWISIENSMKKQFTQFEYLRTLWCEERSSFSADFNDYVRTSIRPFQ